MAKCGVGHGVIDLDSAGLSENIVNLLVLI